MRQINADALADRLDALACDEWNQRASTTWANALKDLADMVRSEPTVDAIPIEWVNMWLENNSKIVRNPDYYDWGFTQEPTDYYVIIYPHEVKRMLNDWEKENEID